MEATCTPAPNAPPDTAPIRAALIISGTSSAVSRPGSTAVWAIWPIFSWAASVAASPAAPVASPTPPRPAPRAARCRRMAPATGTATSSAAAAAPLARAAGSFCPRVPGASSVRSTCSPDSRPNDGMPALTAAPRRPNRLPARPAANVGAMYEAPCPSIPAVKSTTSLKSLTAR